MQKPMLALPMGENDWAKGDRWNFLQSCRPILERLGWTIGVEFKGSMLGDHHEWGEQCVQALNKVGGRMTWHLPMSTTKNLHEGFSPGGELYFMAEQLQFFRGDIEAVTIHCAPAVSVDPPEDAGLERYNSPIGAKEMLAHIKAQVEPLKQLNALMGGILYIENMDIVQFRDGGYKVPTYLALKTGCWEDLLWLKERAGVSITFDSEHFLGAQSLLCRRDDIFPDTEFPRWERDSRNSEGMIFESITGYTLAKGKMPQAGPHYSYGSYIDHAEPRLFHLGGSTRAVDERGRIDTHLPYFNGEAFSALLYGLEYIASHPEVIGAVIDVCGQLPDYSEWSPRPYDDDVAKMETFLDVMNEIETLQKKG